MHKSLIALAGAASIGLVSVAATPSPGKCLVRRLRCRRGNYWRPCRRRHCWKRRSEQPVLLPAGLLLPAAARLLSAAARCLLPTARGRLSAAS